MTWLPFDLHPEYPPEGIPRSQLINRYGEDHVERLRASFSALGLAYNPHPEVVPNTMHALRLGELAREHDLHQPLHDRLMLAYWEEATNIGDPVELRRLAVEVGLEAGDVDRVLQGDAHRDFVLTSTRQAHSIGITGIPGFVLGRRIIVLGAQPRAQFERALAQLAAEDVDRAGGDEQDGNRGES